MKEQGKNWKYAKIAISILFFIFLSYPLLGFVGAKIFTPSEAEIERFFVEGSCDNYVGTSSMWDVTSQLACSHYLRRHSTNFLGQVFRVPQYSFLFFGTPFHYYNDRELGNELNGADDHYTYVWVDTREGRFVYNAFTGEYIKSINRYSDPQTEFSEYIRTITEMYLVLLKEGSECSYNAFDCEAFQLQAHSQAVFEYCKNHGAGDIHHLDEDNDGLACEALP